MPANWTMYGDFLVPGSRLFNTQAEAMDYYFVKTAQTAPYNAACKNYFGSYQFWNPYRSARRVNGEWKFDCTANLYDATKIGAYVIAQGHGCTPTSSNPECFRLYDKSTGKNVGPPKCNGTASCGNPINPGTGNKYQEETDFVVPGSPWLSFSRHYNSSGAAALGGALGPKWRHSFEYQLSVGNNGAISLLRPDGSIKTFSSGMNADAEEQGLLDPIFGPTGTLLGWTYETAARDVETYDNLGRITRLDFKQGGYLTFPTSRVLTALPR